MQSLRLALRTPLASRTLPVRGLPSSSSSYASPLQIRWATQSYGNEQSGQEQGTHLKNPMSHLEHPGPESPASKGTAKKEDSSGSESESSSSTSSTSSSSSSSESGGSGGSGDTSETTSHGGSPKIHRPKSAAEETDPEVKKHNEEMEQRSDRSVNQLSEKDNKVNKNFWKGDVGPKNEE